MTPTREWDLARLEEAILALGDDPETLAAVLARYGFTRDRWWEREEGRPNPADLWLRQWRAEQRERERNWP